MQIPGFFLLRRHIFTGERGETAHFVENFLEIRTPDVVRFGTSKGLQIAGAFCEIPRCYRET